MTMKQSAIICDAKTKVMLQIVVPSYRRELDDPAFHQPGTRQFIIPSCIFDGLEPSQYYAATVLYLSTLDPPSGIKLT